MVKVTNIPLAPPPSNFNEFAPMVALQFFNGLPHSWTFLL